MHTSTGLDRENGELERLGRYWLHGVCKPNMQEKRASEPLSIDQVTNYKSIRF